jgi:hypothetical protein
MTGGFLRRWIERCRAIRRLWQQDARELISRDERSAYYTAQRLAARARAESDRANFVHWVKVAAATPTSCNKGTDCGCSGFPRLAESEDLHALRWVRVGCPATLYKIGAKPRT